MQATNFTRLGARAMISKTAKVGKRGAAAARVEGLHALIGLHDIASAWRLQQRRSCSCPSHIAATDARTVTPTPTICMHTRTSSAQPNPCTLLRPLPRGRGLPRSTSSPRWLASALKSRPRPAGLAAASPSWLRPRHSDIRGGRASLCLSVATTGANTEAPAPRRRAAECSNWTFTYMSGMHPARKPTKPMMYI